MARLSFTDVIKKLSAFPTVHPAYISSDPQAVERYVVVHAQIILQQFSEHPGRNIRNSAFVTGLKDKMEEKHHTKWFVSRKKLFLRTEPNLNPRADIEPVVSKRKAMQATTTRLINRIWGEYYSNYSPEATNSDVIEADENEEQEENEEEDAFEENVVEKKEAQSSQLTPRQPNSGICSKEVKWEGDSLGELPSGEALYRRAIVRGDEVAVRGGVILQDNGNDEFPEIYFVEYMYENLDGKKLLHGRRMQRGCETVLGNTANEREVFLRNECVNLQLDDIKESVSVDIRSIPWGHEHRKMNGIADKIDKARAEERKQKGLPTQFYCRSLYCPERGAFFALPYGSMGLGSGSCQACKLREAENCRDQFRVDASLTDFFYRGNKYSIGEYLYVSPSYFSSGEGRKNVCLRAHVIYQLLDIYKRPGSCDADSSMIQARRFYRPEDISSDKAYKSDIREVSILYHI